jgi:hypothetical protein
MPVLANHRRELFAQLLFQGFPAVDAYQKAGYKTHDGNACILAKHPEILARLEEIRGEGEQGWPVGTRAVAARANVTVESLVQKHDEIYRRALESGQLSAGVSAVKEISVLTGHRVERREVGAPGEFENMTDEELERAHESSCADNRDTRVEQAALLTPIQCGQPHQFLRCTLLANGT